MFAIKGINAGFSSLLKWIVAQLEVLKCCDSSNLYLCVMIIVCKCVILGARPWYLSSGVWVKKAQLINEQTSPRITAAGSLCPHRRNRRSSSWGGRKRTSVSSTIWSCRPSSPGGPCTSSLWGWRRGRCRCCGPTTPRGRAGRTPPCGSAGSVSSDGPVRKSVTLFKHCEPSGEDTGAVLNQANHQNGFFFHSCSLHGVLNK